MGRGVINVPLRNVAEFIKDVQNNMTWDDLLIVSVADLLFSKVLGTVFQHSTTILY